MIGRVLVRPPGLAVLGVGFLILATGFILRMPWATSLWPDGGPWVSPLSFLFVGSMLAAVGAAAVYAAWIGDSRVAAGGSIALLVLYAAMAVATAAFWFAGRPGLGGHALTFAIAAAVVATLLGASLAAPRTDPKPVPALVRLAFVVFAVVLLATGTSLILRLPNVFPWPLLPLSSVLYGCMFLGFAANYAYVAWRGTMREAKVSLVGFAVYDLVLIVPFIRHFGVVAPEMRTSLTIYTGVLVFSAIVAVYCFVADRRSV
jgi:hypothetical protein